MDVNETTQAVSEDDRRSSFWKISCKQPQLHSIQLKCSWFPYMAQAGGLPGLNHQQTDLQGDLWEVSKGQHSPKLVESNRHQNQECPGWTWRQLYPGHLHIQFFLAAPGEHRKSLSLFVCWMSYSQAWEIKGNGASQNCTIEQLKFSWECAGLQEDLDSLAYTSLRSRAHSPLWVHSGTGYEIGPEYVMR